MKITSMSSKYCEQKDLLRVTSVLSSATNHMFCSPLKYQLVLGRMTTTSWAIELPKIKKERVVTREYFKDFKCDVSTASTAILYTFNIVDVYIRI